MKNTFKLSTVAAALAVAGGVSFSSQTMAAVPLAGTNISNVATATYTDNTGTERVVTSNEVKTLVAQIGSFTLEADRSAQTTPNGQVTFSHILTNTGNGTDKFSIGLKDIDDSDTTFDFSSGGKYAIYIDRNKDGMADSNVALTGTDLIELAAGESVGLVVVATTPSTAMQGQLDKLKITATAQTASLYTVAVKSNTDITRITTGAVLQITKAANVSVTEAGKEIEYTLTFKNTGNAAAKNVAIFDVLPGTVTYVAGSAKYNGGSALTDAKDAADKFEYYFDEKTNKDGTKEKTLEKFLFNIDNVAQNTSGKLTFKVLVKGGTNAGDIKNTAYVDPDGKPTDPLDPNSPKTPLEITDVPTEPNQPPTPADPNNPTVPSNPSIVVVEGTYDGSINDSKLDSFKDGDSITVSGAVGDDKITIAGQQGVPIVFGKSSTEGDMVVVHNRGNSTDTYNLTVDKTVISGFGKLPDGAIVEILKADGNTPATDTNGDGIVDTGPIAVGDKLQFVVRVTLPNGEKVVAPGVGITMVSTSVKNAQKDTLKLIISELTENKVDLVNKPTTGGEKGTGAGTPTPVDNETTPPAAPTIFDITIKNEGNIPDNYIITVPDVPAGWTVEIFEKDSSGDCTKAKVANSGNIKPSESKSFCLVVTPPADTLAGTKEDIKVEIKSPATGTSDNITFNVGVEEQRQLTFTPDRQGQVAPGGTIVYSHTLTNTGNVLEGAGPYQLNIDWTSTLSGVNTSVYVDIDGDGKQSANELITGATEADRTASLAAILATINTTNTAAGLSPKESVSILVKVEAPATASAGESDTTVVTFKPAASLKNPAFNDETIYPNYKAAPTPSNVSITDRTVINLGQVRLVKTQALSAKCESVPTAYAETKLDAKPGDCVYYKIVASNDGNADAENVVITDMVPSYTAYLADSADPAAAAPATGTKELKYAVGTLTPAATAELKFAVQVDSQ